MRLSIFRKILLLLLCLAVPPLLLIGWLSLSTLSDVRDMAIDEGTEAMRTQVHETLERRVQDKARRYNSELAAVENQVNMTARQAELLLTTDRAAPAVRRVWVAPTGPTATNLRQHRVTVAQARQVIPLVTTVVEHSPLVNLAYVAFHDGGVIGFSDESVIDTLQANAPFDPRLRPWYQSALTAEGTVWTNGYVDANTGALVMTCAMSISTQEGELLGVVGLDLLLETLQTDLLTVDIGAGGFALLVNEQGEVLVGPDPAADTAEWQALFQIDNLLDSDSAELRQVTRRMLNLSRNGAAVGVEQFEYADTQIFVAFAPIETANWSVALVIPEEEVVLRPVAAIEDNVDAGQMALRQQMVTLLIGLIVFIGLLGYGLAHSFTRPIRELQRGARDIRDGTLDHQLHPAGSDEIGQLVESFNVMTVALRQKIAQLEDNAHQLAQLNIVSNNFRSILDLQRLYQAIPQALCEYLGFEHATLYLVESNQLRVVAAYFGPENADRAERFVEIASAAPIRLDSPVIEADAVRSGRAMVVNNPWNHSRAHGLDTSDTANNTYVQVPIPGDDGQIIGLISANHYRSTQPSSSRDVNQLQTFAMMVGLTIANVRLYEDLEATVARRTEELRAALGRAQLADRRKSEFLASISHELRTPLNAIIGFSTVLLDDIDGPLLPAQREDIESIHRNGRELLHMINGLLDLARIEAGHLDVECAPLDMLPLLNEVYVTAQGLIHDHEQAVGLRLVLPDDLPPVYADAVRVRQIMLNLLSNAIKFTEQGTITVQVHGAATANGSSTVEGNALAPVERGSLSIVPFLAISVQDTGIGIPPELQSRVFEEFSQAHGQRSRAQGTGLGLAIVRRLVEMQGGSIWLESIPGEGSTFTFTLLTMAGRQTIPTNDCPPAVSV